jgi:hypothetical protein
MCQRVGMDNNASGKDRRVALLREFEGCGLSMAEFCRRREVAYSTMMAWRRAGRQGWPPQERRAAFVEVEAVGVSGVETVRDPGHGTVCAELMLPGGAVLRIYQMASAGGRA